jgi:hypothetical protein
LAIVYFLGSLLKITKAAQINGQFFQREKMFINPGKKCVWLHLGDFLKNSSGHPGHCPMIICFVIVLIEENQSSFLNRLS